MKLKQFYFKTITLETMSGANIEQCKEEAKNLAKNCACKVTFSHNDNKYICDEEGNCVKLN